MEKFNKADLQELFELAKGYEMIEEFIKKYNKTDYINFDYKNLSYYEEPNLNLMVDGKNGTVYEGNFEKCLDK